VYVLSVVMSGRGFDNAALEYVGLTVAATAVKFVKQYADVAL
jgi:hypothetical protein